MEKTSIASAFTTLMTCIWDEFGTAIDWTTCGFEEPPEDEEDAWFWARSLGGVPAHSGLFRPDMARFPDNSAVLFAVDGTDLPIGIMRVYHTMDDFKREQAA